MRLKIAVLIAVLLSPAFCLGQALSDRVPADALIYVGWNGADSMGPGYDQSHLKAILASSQIGTLLSDSLPQLISRVAGPDQDAADVMNVIDHIGGPIWHHPTAFYFGGVDFTQQDPNPKVALLCDAGADAAKLADDLNALLAKGGPDFQPPHIFVKIIDTVVVVSSYVYVAPDNALSQSDQFKAALTQAPKDPVILAYVDGTGLMAAVDQGLDKGAPPEIKANWAKIRDASGLAGLKKIVAGGGFSGKNWVAQVFVDAPAPRTGLLSMLDSAPLSDETIKLIPSTSTLALAGRFDLAALYKTVHDGIAQFSPDMGNQFDQAVEQANQALGFDVDKDFLSAFGPEWASYIDPASSGSGGLGFVFMNRARNADALEGSLSKLETMANTLIAQFMPHNKPRITIEFRQSIINGVKVHYLATPLITPSWAIKDGVWYLAMYPQIVVSATSGSKDGKSILDNPAFIDVRKRLGGPDKVSGFSFVDLPKVTPDGYQTLLAISRLYLGMGDMFGLNAPPMVLPPLDKIMAEMEPAGEITWTDDAGFHYKSVMPFPGSEIFSAGSNIGGMAPAEAGVMMSVLLPSLNKSREAANRVKSASNLRQIGLAIILYTNDTKGDYPPDLGTLIKTEDLTGPVFINPRTSTQLPGDWGQLSPDDQAKWINDNSDYVYLGAGLKAGADPTIIVAHEKEGPDTRSGINLLFADGHVEFLPLRQAHEALDKSKSLRDNPQ